METTITAPVSAPPVVPTPPTTSDTTPPVSSPAAPSGHLGSFIDDKGAFKPGWSKVYGLPEGYEKKFTSPESFFKTAYAADRMISSSNKVSVPSENSTAEERSEFYNKLGRPEKPEGYELKMPEKIGDKPFPKELWSDDRAKSFAAFAHEQGLTKAQAQALVAYQANNGLTDYESVTGAQQKAVEDAQTALKTEWGPKYADNLKLAQKAAEQAGGADLLAHPLANDPVFIKAMAKVGAMIVEQPAAGARGTSHSQADPKSEIARIRGDRSHPYNVTNHPGHDAAVQQMQSLYKQLHPGMA